MRMTGLVLGMIILVAACGPEGKARAASDAVVADAPNPGAAWPLMLQHCLRSPACDPTADFGKGAGQASGLAETVTWFAETSDVVKGGGRTMAQH